MWIRKGANEDLNYHPLVSAVSAHACGAANYGPKWLPAGDVKTRPKDHGLKDWDQRTDSLRVKSVWLWTQCCVVLSGCLVEFKSQQADAAWVVKRITEAFDCNSRVLLLASFLAFPAFLPHTRKTLSVFFLPFWFYERSRTLG